MENILTAAFFLYGYNVLVCGRPYNGYLIVLVRKREADDNPFYEVRSKDNVLTSFGTVYACYLAHANDPLELILL